MRALRAQHPAASSARDTAPKNILIAAGAARRGKFLYIHFPHPAGIPLLFLINARYRPCVFAARP
jgi:hypothetical protein